MSLESEIGYGGLDRAEMKHQFKGTIGSVIPVFKIIDKETLDVKDRWIKIKSRGINNSFIIGHNTNGTIGGTIGDFRGSLATFRIIQGDDTYREWFYDNEFMGTNTTASWDTTNNYLVIGSAEVVESTSIYYNNGTITRAKLTAFGTINGGTMSYWMASDGSSYEPVTSGALHEFATLGVDLRWMGSLDAGAGTLSSVEIEIIT